MGYGLDLVLLGILLLFVYLGVRRGFLRSAVHFLGTILAAGAASLLGGAAAQWVFDTLFRGALVEKIGESLASLAPENATAAVQGVLSGLPDFILRALEDAGITASTMAGTIASQTGQAAELIADALAPVFVGFLKVLAVIVLFFLFSLLVRVLANFVGSAFRLPLLKQVDGILGGAFGLLLALFSIWIAISAIQVFTPMLSAEAQGNVEAVLRQSILTRMLLSWNPMGGMFH